LAWALPGLTVEEVLDEEGHGLDVHPSFFHAGKIHVPRRETVPDIQPLKEDPVSQVVVAIPDQGLLVESRKGFIGEGRSLLTGNATEKEACAEADQRRVEILQTDVAMLLTVTGLQFWHVILPVG
jgi:hypothetical protein